jgi:hypothetical protein
LSGQLRLPQDWTDLHSFAGIIPGERWAYGVPYRQTLHAVTNPVMLEAPGARAVLVAYAPPENQALTRAPVIVWEDGSHAALSGKPAPAWRAWPPIFDQVVLLDYAIVPDGRSLRQVNPNSCLLMAITQFQGSSGDWLPVQTALTAAGTDFAQTEAQRLALIDLRTNFAQLPAGRIAVLPRPGAGAATTFGALTGLRKQWVELTEPQLVDSNWFNASRFPLTLYLSGEHYVKTVNATGDGKAAVTRYLAAGGTLVLLATEPFPFYYGDGPADKAGSADVLLPALGLPLENAFEQAPPNLQVQTYSDKAILASVPSTFPFPPGDPRLRAINRSRLNPANRYMPLLKVTDAQGHTYGDAAGYLEFHTGAAKGGKVLYVWSTLLSGPQGQAILSDIIRWMLDATLRPTRINSIQVRDRAYAVLDFSARPNLSYALEYRDRFEAGAWARLPDLASAPTNRLVSLTNLLSDLPARFYRLGARP